MKQRRKRPYFALVIGAFVIAVVLRVLQPANTFNPTNLSKATVIILSITIIVPYLWAWVLGAMSWYHCNQLVRKGEQKKWVFTPSFRLIAWGIGLIVLDLISTALLSSLRDIFSSHQATLMGITIASNLFHIFIPLLAFSLMHRGSRELVRLGTYTPTLQSKVLPVMLPVFIFALFFSFLIFTNPSRQFPFEPGADVTYFFPDMLIFLLVVCPLAVTWLLGLRTVLNVERFTHSLPNRLLRRPVVHFFYGILSLIGSSIILQAITALGSQRFQELGLVTVLLLLYLFLILQGLAYLLVSRSARQLYKLIN